jgi:short-subunit dehydrogenase
MAAAKRGTIVNVTSVTGLELPPFSGEAVYHATKAFQEGFTDSLRNELMGTNVRVLALRPGVVQTNFHEQRVGYDQGQYESFVDVRWPEIMLASVRSADFPQSGHRSTGSGGCSEGSSLDGWNASTRERKSA